MQSHKEPAKEQVDDGEGFLTNPTPLIVSAEEYEWLCQQLDAPPRDLPRLRELLKEKPIWCGEKIAE